MLYGAPVAKGTKKIDALAELLERTGGDAERLEVVRRTQRFKRSWIELAETLQRIRSTRAFTRWGFDDFYTYCSEELTLKRPTVDKLVLSFNTIQSHAPEVLEWDGVARVIPSYEAVDYFSRAVGKAMPEDDDVDPGPPPEGEDEAPRPRRRRGEGEFPEVLQEVKQAVFDEGQPVTELRKRFDQVLFPRPKGAEKLDVIRKASAAARALAELLPDIEGADAKRIQRLEIELGGLREELDALGEEVKKGLERPAKKKPPRLRVAAPV